MHALFMVVDMALGLYMWCLVLMALMSWLIVFNVVNTHNRFVYQLNDFLYRVTDPVLRPIRRIIPLLGGIDISPVILILLISFLRQLIRDNYYAVGF